MGQCLLGRHVLHSADHGAGLRHSVAFEGLGQAEVHDQNAAALFAHDVLRLQVTVDHAYVVGRLKRPAHLLDDCDCILRRELGPLMEDVRRDFHPRHTPW